MAVVILNNSIITLKNVDSSNMKVFQKSMQINVLQGMHCGEMPLVNYSAEYIVLLQFGLVGTWNGSSQIQTVTCKPNTAVPAAGIVAHGQIRVHEFLNFEMKHGIESKWYRATQIWRGKMAWLWASTVRNGLSLFESCLKSLAMGTPNILSYDAGRRNC